MISSILLAKFLGLFITTMGLGFVLNQSHIKQIVNVLAENPGIQAVATLLPVLLGSFLIVAHNEWNSHEAILVSLVSWFIFLNGVFRAIFPGVWVGLIKTHKDNFAAGTIGVVFLILGLVLLYMGFGLHL